MNSDYVESLERIAEIIREETRTTSDGTIHNSTDVAKAILTRIPALRASAAPEEGMSGAEWFAKCKDLSVFHDALKRYPSSFEALHFLWNCLPPAALSPSVGTPAQTSAAAHLRQIKAFASAINERNFLDIALHISRQADDALALTSAHGKTP